MPENIVLPTRRLAPALVELLRALKPGDKVKITQTVRVGARTWPAEATGTFRGLAYLQTGVTTERVKDDDLVVPVVRFTKPNGELASISIDEHTKVERA
jgi:antitoxin (DNA-binding transcriptional repressor) of toxin-antitoxin stability system